MYPRSAYYMRENALDAGERLYAEAKGRASAIGLDGDVLCFHLQQAMLNRTRRALHGPAVARDSLRPIMPLWERRRFSLPGCGGCRW